MPDHRVIIVGTDGSETSIRAVEKAAGLAAESNARLVVASAYQADHHPSGAPDPDQPRDERYRTTGNAPVYDLLRDASSRARKAGAHDVEERAVEGAPADALVALAEELDADLLVVGSVGMNSMVGRLVGSVPRLVRKRAKTEVLIVETD
ncbi:MULTISPECIES: universal stress protein [Mycobacteriaceae]|uniref:Universal stress protein n=1 Tax=Mycolicibacterium poriferae TaxID=39694 RepID=A0A6N4V5X9_9MYCO|nr:MULTISPECIES: universal stress protein [Mycolicibacterium]MCG7583957.1 universal stress protein [Mycolicibacterium sp. OfavD-34-C]MCV7264062.1 universal stress protein [Mycolicibacterium poriferae]QFS89377.1 Universal stress protein [Mycobacterium sp. THAF192]BBX49799.1 universal stress protein [Mycolicibacterium poriferae]